MDEQALRALVRDAIEKHLGSDRSLGAPPPLHPSHARFNLLSGAETGGPCLIEPAVMCNHCGYCKSYGH